jgi:hypothetical protein
MGRQWRVGEAGMGRGRGRGWVEQGQVWWRTRRKGTKFVGNVRSGGPTTDIPVLTVLPAAALAPGGCDDWRVDWGDA